MIRLWILAVVALMPLWGRADIIDIDNAELERLRAAKVPVIDIRTEPEWRETGVIPGSRLLTFFDDKGRADPGGWLARMRPIAPPDKPVIVICRSGNRTQAVAKFLSQQAGYGQVYNVKAGIKGWQKEGKALIDASPQLSQCREGAAC